MNGKTSFIVIVAVLLLFYSIFIDLQDGLLLKKVYSIGNNNKEEKIVSQYLESVKNIINPKLKVNQVELDFPNVPPKASRKNKNNIGGNLKDNKEGAYIVQFDHEPTEVEKKEISETYNLSFIKKLGRSGLYSVFIRTYEAATRLKNSKVAEYVESNEKLYVKAQTTDWSTIKVNAPTVWSMYTGKGVTVAVLDTGVQLDHPDLEGQFNSGYDFTNFDWVPSDDNGHGTSVTGIIASKNNLIGNVGISYDAKIIPIKIGDYDGSAFNSDLIAGIYFAVEKGADIINISFGGSSYSDAEYQAILYAYDHDVVVVASAGNAGLGECDYPGRYWGVICVSALTNTNNLSSYSNYGNSYSRLSAPGDNIYSTNILGNYRAGSGTSYASPVVAGIAALIKEKCQCGGYLIRQIMERSAYDLGETGEDPLFGAGLVDAQKALNTVYFKIQQSSPEKSSEKGRIYSKEVTISNPAANGALIHACGLRAVNVSMTNQLVSAYNITSLVADGVVYNPEDLSAWNNNGHIVTFNDPITLPGNGVKTISLSYLLDEATSAGDELNFLVSCVFSVPTDPGSDSIVYSSKEERTFVTNYSVVASIENLSTNTLPMGSNAVLSLKVRNNTATNIAINKCYLVSENLTYPTWQYVPALDISRVSNSNNTYSNIFNFDSTTSYWNISPNVSVSGSNETTFTINYSLDSFVGPGEVIRVWGLCIYTAGSNPENLLVGHSGYELITTTTVKTAPGVLTRTLSAQSSNSLTVSGNVITDGGSQITERGFVYSLSNQVPTLLDTKSVVEGEVGFFQAIITNLSIGQKYYIRAYAKNEMGTMYGSVLEFTTTPLSLQNVYVTFSRFKYNKYVSPSALRAGDTAYIKNFNTSKLKLLQIFLYDYEKRGNQGFTKSNVTSTSMFLRTSYLLPTGKRYAYVFKFQDRATGIVATKYFVVYTTKTWLGRSTL